MTGVQTCALPICFPVTIFFRVLDFEAGFDSVVVYKNSVSGANRLGQFSGAVLPFAGAWKAEKADRLIFIQYSDQMLEGKGFKVEYVGVFTPVVASLGRDTVICSGVYSRCRCWSRSWYWSFCRSRSRS